MTDEAPVLGIHDRAEMCSLSVEGARKVKNNQLNNKLANTDKRNEVKGQVSRRKGHLQPHLLKRSTQRQS